jgi:hypothetical protein
VNHHDKQLVLLDLIFSIICKELDREGCGHNEFFAWERENRVIINEEVTPEVIDWYFTIVGEKKTRTSNDLAKRILQRMPIAASA